MGMAFRSFLAQAALILSAVALSAGAHAQETGTLIKHKAAQIDEMRTKAGARLVAEQFGACVVDRSEGRVTKLAFLPIGSREYVDIWESLTEREDPCISNGELTLSSMTLRGAIFQAMYLRKYAKKPLLPFAPELSTGYRALYPEDVSGEARMAVALEQFGECVAKADPAAARRLLLANSSSSAESSAIAELSPKFSGCIVAGEKITLSKLIAKGAIAEAMYRLMRAAEGAPAVKS